MIHTHIHNTWIHSAISLGGKTFKVAVAPTKFRDLGQYAMARPVSWKYNDFLMTTLYQVRSLMRIVQTIWLTHRFFHTSNKGDVQLDVSFIGEILQN